MTAETVALDWRRLGACTGHPDAYDKAVDTRKAAREQFIADFCGRPCPVRARCLAYGTQTGSTGIYGGVRLAYGRPHTSRRAPGRTAAAAEADRIVLAPAA